MAYFYSTFGYSLTGIDYLDLGVELSARNLEMQGIPATVLRGDVMDLRLSLDRFDVVFSGGLVEHFTDPISVCRQIAELSCGYIVTTVPNLFGVNGLAIRVLRSDDFRKHIRIDRERLRSVHESCGIRTLYCDYTGGAQLHSVTERSRFFAGRPLLTKLVDRSVDTLNTASTRFSRLSRWSPRWRLLSPSLVYLGRVASSRS